MYRAVIGQFPYHVFNWYVKFSFPFSKASNFSIYLIVFHFYLDRTGRKILFTLSSFGAGIGMLILALHRLYKDELPESNWVPIYVLSLTIFIASIGLMPVPFIITIDVLPPKVNCVF